MSKTLRWTVGTVVGLALLWLGAFVVDGLVTSGEVVRNTDVARRPIGGLGEEALRRELLALASDIEDLPITLIAPARGFRGTASQWGISLDVEATHAKAMEVGRGGALSRLIDWTSGFVSHHEVEPVLVVDAAVVEAEIAARPATMLRRPVEPSFHWSDGAIDVRQGSAGQALDSEAVVSALRQAVAVGVVPPEVEINWALVAPVFDADDVAAALDDAAALTDSPIPISLNGRSTVVPPETARRWVESTTESGSLMATFNETAARTDLAIRLSSLATTQDPPTFTIVDGAVVTELDEPVMVCCEAPVASMVEEAARTGQLAELTARQRDADGGQALADAFGITELVAEFTTNHSCCQSRVTNIQRMADIVRGAVIAPGATFSINDYVGVRTEEKGFVAAGAIERGHLVQDVGGGVSQFATTLFNAAFFAGLDFADYQSHTIYFSRYPRGREATLGHPAPDLALTNNTPYGVLIWPEYTDTSITVQLWSTPHFVSEQTAQWSGRWGTACTRVTTERTRVAPDGSEIVDTVFATYRPAEGVDCLGNRIPPPRR